MFGDLDSQSLQVSIQISNSNYADAVIQGVTVRWRKSADSTAGAIDNECRIWKNLNSNLLHIFTLF